MTSKNKKILWYIAGATLVALVAMYIFVPPVHNWVNSVIGRDEKGFPQPNQGDTVEYEYGTPVESIEGERIEVQRDSLLDSLVMADTTLAGVVVPVDGPPPAHVEGFGEGPLPPAPSEDNLPTKNELTPEEQAQLEGIMPSVEDIMEIEKHTSDIPAVNKKIAECRLAFDKLLGTYREYQTEPSTKLKAEGSKQKESLLKALTQLMKLSQTKNDEAGMEEAADLRREVNKMEF
jgi:hypothetical protein